MFLKILPARIWQFGLVLVFVLGLAFYLILGKGAKSSITEQLLSQQQTLARAETSNVQSFFQTFGHSISVFAQLRGGESNTEVIYAMDTFVDRWGGTGLVGGVVLTDRNGIARFNSNVSGTSDVGASLSDRDYFVWAKNKAKGGEYFVGTPVASRLGPTKGQIIVPVAAPVYQNGVFVGVTAASVKLGPLTTRYLELMRVSDSANVYLVNKDGNLIYSTSGRDMPDSIKNSLKPTEEGRLQTKEYLVAYSPVFLGSQNWLLVMASPNKNVSDAITPTYIRQTAMLLLVSMSLFMFGIISARTVGSQKRLE